MDKVTKAARSEIMSKVKSRETKLEKSFRRLLWNSGIRYRKNNPKYFGKPDVLIKKYKTVVFIDSCFWHGCGKHLRMPSTNKKYWTQKIKMNVERDREVSKYYKNISWKIIRIWEHELKNTGKNASIIKTILD